MVPDFFEKGWTCFAPQTSTVAWAERAAEYAKVAVQSPENAHLHQCEGTWFVGLDILPNDAQGRVLDGPPLTGEAIDFAGQNCGGWPDLHRAQVSVIYNGYPKPRAGENGAGFRYRKNRDAAHVDGVIGLGTPKRRFVQEPHAFILGIPLTWASAEAAPLVVWEGSHHIMRTALREAYEGVSWESLQDVDVTEVYKDARKKAFETCRRVKVHGPVGSASLVHRLTLHGVAPWGEKASASHEGRMIAYFRPVITGGVAAWLTKP